MAKTGKYYDARNQPIFRVLDRLIQEAGFTRAEVERRLGWGRQKFSRVANGRQSLTLAIVHDVLEVLDVPPSIFAELWALELRTQSGSGDELENLVDRVVRRGLTGRAFARQPKK